MKIPILANTMWLSVWVAILAALPMSGAELVSLTNSWRYSQLGLNLGTAWKEIAFDDSVLPSGRGVFGLEINPLVSPLINTPLSLTNAAGAQTITYYFRTHFTFSGDPANVLLQASNLVDDGAVVYLNGVELYRLNMPTGAVDYLTFASGAAIEGAFSFVGTNASNLVVGDNVLAVEVHQTSSNSTDVVFGMTLDAVPILGPPVILSQPTNRTAYAGVTHSFSVSHNREAAYQWFKDSVALPGETRQTLLLEGVQLSDSGAYHVVLSNAFGTVATTNAVLTVLEPPVELSSFTNAWRYLDTGADLGTAWRESGFDDSVWATGAGVGGFPLNEPLPGPLYVQTPLAMSNSLGTRIITYYFRSHFNVTNNPSNVALTLAAVIDDGAVFYLNGWEVGRVGMPPGPITSQTLANRNLDVGDNPGRFDTFAVSSDYLLPGENVLAVEVHQASATSSDLVYGLGVGVSVLPDSPLTITGQPADAIAFVADSLALSVGIDGMGARFQWFKDSLPIPGATMRILRLAQASLGDGGVYRLVASNSVNAVTSAPVALIVCDGPQNRVATEGSAVNLAVVSAGPGPLTFQWLLNGIALPGQTNTALLFNPARLDQTGYYYVSVRRGNTEAASSSAKLTVLSWVNQLFYTADFNAGVGAEWSRTNTDITPVGRRRFLGQFGNDTVRLTLTNLPPHTEVNVAFDLFIIRSWDGDGEPGGPDVWRLGVNESNTFQTTFVSYLNPWLQAYPGIYPANGFPAWSGAAEVDTLGFWDAVYNLCFQIPHTSNALTADFVAAGLEGLINESWGIDNVVVSLANVPVGVPPLITTSREAWS